MPLAPSVDIVCGSEAQSRWLDANVAAFEIADRAPSHKKEQIDEIYVVILRNGRRSRPFCSGDAFQRIFGAGSG